MKIKISFAIFLALAVIFSSCEQLNERDDLSLKYPKLLNISHKPQTFPRGGQGYFTDHGSWMGFNLPQDTLINGFVGPVNLDARGFNARQWVSQAITNVSAIDASGQEISSAEFNHDDAVYYPGMIELSTSAKEVKLNQKLVMVDENHALLRIKAEGVKSLMLTGLLSSAAGKFKSTLGASVLTVLPHGEVVTVSFPANIVPEIDSLSYTVLAEDETELDLIISHYNNEADYEAKKQGASVILANADKEYDENRERWNDYIANNLRADMAEDYNRVAVKAIMTLMSNWRSPKAGLLHAGCVPSHAVGYFVGFWAWDSWKHAVVLADIAPELAKDQVRTMFDYQSPEGMIADCIYSNSEENNWRDSKPPLATWAVDKIYEVTKDKEFLAEIYPKLLKYHQWWYQYRDHDKNGICEYGATDATLVAAKWESGMDNAVRFDQSKMLENSEGAYSMDQEAVDLNAYLVYELKLLKKLAAELGQSLEMEDRTEEVKSYFFDAQDGYFYDKRLGGDFIREQGPEGWTPIWTQIATQEQVSEAVKIIFDPKKFSTYIPFPTVAADNPGFTPNGYWRGPIWLDQVYFGISGIRKYGYTKEADEYTDQVFTRLDGLLGDAPIHENYETSTGKRLKAPHFSWSSAHLLMLYKEYGK